jgi:hypothetical protein
MSSRAIRPALLVVLLSLTSIILLAQHQSVVAVADATVKVYKTPKGKKYHTADCRYVRNNSGAQEITLDEAKKLGLGPCSVCNPPPLPK